jgi:hypothetical protein
MISLNRSSESVPAFAKNVDVRTAIVSALDMPFAPGDSMNLGTPRPVIPSKLFYTIPSIIVASAKNISPSTPHTLLRQSPLTRTPSSILPFASSLKMACPTAKPVGIFGETIGFMFLSARSKVGSERQGKKTYSHIETDVYLDGALENFSGYIAVDEVYDGPFCILFIVDNRQYNRLMFRVLDHSPKATDILALFQAFHKILTTRELKLSGITTDGAALYTEPVKTVFPGVRHQICEFHVKKEINKAVLKAVTQVRRELKQMKTKRSKRGRPTTKEEKAIIRKNERIDAKITDLFDNRFLFVQKELTASEWKTFRKITRGFPELRKLREMVDLVYGLYDRRCKRTTALAKLEKLRERLKRFDGLSDVLKKIEAPTVDRSLVFLDDKKLPSTSNAVERGNRRFRKMQKTVYRVRTIDRIRERIALDMVRDSRLLSQRQTMLSLKVARTTPFHQLC